MCTREDKFAHTLGMLCINDVMSSNSLTTRCQSCDLNTKPFTNWTDRFRLVRYSDRDCLFKNFNFNVLPDVSCPWPNQWGPQQACSWTSSLAWRTGHPCASSWRPPAGTTSSWCATQVQLCPEKHKHSEDLNINYLNLGNIWNPNFLKFRFEMVGY